MSRTAEYLNFQLSTEDDDAAAFTMSSDQINPIVHLTQTETPIVLTYDGEFSLSGSATKAAITPTNYINNDNLALNINASVVMLADSIFPSPSKIFFPSKKKKYIHSLKCNC